ncbi:MAG: hypothetical protein JEZ08_18445 [Clostridiales bacterium]|nr:hypothetical protein [Clostridiales bacterium]
MKTLILFASKYGTTKKCSELIAADLTDIEISDIQTATDISLESFDRIIIGTSAYFGRPDKKLSDYIKQNQSILLSKKIALFMCSKETSLEQTINKELYDHAQYKYHFGYELNISKMKFMDKLVTKKITQVSNDESHLKLEQLNELIQSLKIS